MNNSPRILITDDDKQYTAMLRQAFERKGYVVLTAYDGNEALQTFHREPPDLAIIDILMPEKEGLETIQSIKKEHPNTKIIAISGGSFLLMASFNLRIAAQMGADRTLQKPFDLQEILQATHDLLNTAGPNGVRRTNRRRASG